MSGFTSGGPTGSKVPFLPNEKLRLLSMPERMHLPMHRKCCANHRPAIRPIRKGPQCQLSDLPKAADFHNEKVAAVAGRTLPWYWKGAHLNLCMRVGDEGTIGGGRRMHDVELAQCISRNDNGGGSTISH